MSLNVAGVYRVRHLTTGGTYVGQSSLISRRWDDHKAALGSGSHSSTSFQAAYDCDGAAAFVVEVLEAIEDRQARVAAEARWIRKLLPTYNRRHVAPLSEELAADRQRRFRERKAMLGKCSRCPAPAADGMTVCAACSAAAYERVKAARAAKKAAHGAVAER